MKKYSYKEIADAIKIAPSQISSKVKRKDFPKEFKTKIRNEQGKEINALTEDGFNLLKEEYHVTDKRVSDEDKVLLGELELVKEGEFLGTICDFYKDMNNNVYMTREQIANALDYAGTSAIENFHFKNKDDFDKLSVTLSEFSKVVNNDKIIKNTRFDKPTTNDGTPSNQANNPLSNLQPNTVLYNEDGIYEITFLSRQPKAKQFRKWVRERIKEIRKFGFTTKTKSDGTHMLEELADFILGKEDSVEKVAFIKLAKTKMKLEMENKKQEDLISQLDKQISDNAPKVTFAEQVAFSKDAISVSSMAKLLNKNGIDIGQHRLYDWLRDNKLVMRIKENKSWNNIPTQKAVDRNYLIIEERSFLDKYGMARVSNTTRVTEKGQRYILNKFIELKENK